LASDREHYRRGFQWVLPAGQDFRRQANLTRRCFTKPGTDNIETPAHNVAAAREILSGRKDLQRTYIDIHLRRHRGWIALVSHRLRLRPQTALSATVWRKFDRLLPKCIAHRVKDARATYAEQKKNGTVEPLRRSRFRALLTVAANRSVKGEQPKVSFFYEDS
jgi:hypothetical protein